MLLIIEYLLDFPNHYPKVTFFAFLVFELLVNTLMLVYYSPYTEQWWYDYVFQSFSLFGNEKYNMFMVKGHGSQNMLRLLMQIGISRVEDHARTISMIICLLTWIVIYLIYYKSRTPFFYLPLLTLSRCLRLTYLSGLSDDSISMLLLYSAILLLLNCKYKVATLCFSISLSIRANTLLFLPAWALILLVQTGFLNAIYHLSLITAVYSMSLFFISNSLFLESIPCEVTVNWAFIPSSFDSSIYVVSIISYIAMLSIFFAFWSKVSGDTRLFFIRSIMYPKDPHIGHFSLEDQLTILFTCNFIGILCIPCLYSFYPWYFHTLPFLVYKSNLFIPLQYIIFFTIEICWSIIPPTIFSSFCLMFVHVILFFGLLRYHYLALRLYRMYSSLEEQ